MTDNRKFVPEIHAKTETVLNYEQKQRQEQETNKQLKESELREKKYQFTTNWFEPHIPRWQKTLFHLKDKQINVLEIGVFEGRSTTWILEELLNNSKSRLVAVDIFEKFWWGYDHEKTFRENIRKSGHESQVEIIKNNSFAALTELNQQSPTKFDFIYIDGSHTACDVLSDAVLCWNLLKERGILIFDDYEWDYYEEEYNNPRLAVDAFLKCYQQQIEIIYKRYQVAIRKVSRESIRTEREDKTIY